MIGVVLVVMAMVMIAHNRAAPTDAGALPATLTSAHPPTSTTHVSRNSGSRSASEPACRAAVPRLHLPVQPVVL